MLQANGINHERQYLSASGCQQPDKKKSARIYQGQILYNKLAGVSGKATSVVDDGRLFDVIFLDFSKAFDKVPRERLLTKLHGHGIRGQLLKWIESWLTGRTQSVMLNGEFSAWIDVMSGVPQGSVLGPLLFLTFIKDIDEAAGKIDVIKKFADETKIGNVAETTEDRQKLQRAMDMLGQWAETWGMAFNTENAKLCTWAGAMENISM